MLLFAFPSHQRPGLWRSARPYGDLTAFVLRPYGDQSRPYGVLVASFAFLVRSYCDHSRSDDAIDVQRAY
ncbi:hypothetical protein DPMN_107790 [Dreissena polymorpha]|uniref:Uncharacterized protein n=1 Tax=Dreissena polymorpha TaxID=45954 RepID=A0A9D4QK76_DREPO|nr:hypothetical protein DPMN_107790 [Dreissena polymorpha]